MTGEQWHEVHSIKTEPGHKDAIKVVFNSPVNARFIKIEAEGFCRLSLDEVEVYGPEQ
jgi:hypothetical protein